jgi:hypothetical protein
MDRNFYNQTRAKEYQQEISRELATRHLLKEAKREYLNLNQARGLVVRVAPAAIVMAILLVSFLR